MRIKLDGTNSRIFLVKIHLQVKKLSTGTFIGEIQLIIVVRRKFEYQQNSVSAVFGRLGLSGFVYEHQNRKNKIEKLPVIRKLSIDFLMAKSTPWLRIEVLGIFGKNHERLFFFCQICFKKSKAVNWDSNRRYPVVSSGGKWNWTKRKTKTDWSNWHIFV